MYQQLYLKYRLESRRLRVGGHAHSCGRLRSGRPVRTTSCYKALRGRSRSPGATSHAALVSSPVAARGALLRSVRPPLRGSARGCQGAARDVGRRRCGPALLQDSDGSRAETGGAITLFAATELGIPVSTTHTITGCIIGVGAARRASAVRWSVANDIVVAWIITIPAAAFIAALAYALVGLF